MTQRTRAVAYLRQSTYREESISLELQETACRDYAKRHGYDVIAVHSDPGISGRTFKRPGVQAVMGMIERHEADTILLWKWSRLSRNRLDWYVAADRCQQAGGAIESATEPIDTSTSIGRLSRGMMIEIAAFESERAGDQWREAHERRVKQGLPHTGRARFGYIYDVDLQTYRPDPVTGPMLVDMYRRYIGGASFHALTSMLTQHGVPTAQGGRWAVPTIKVMLDSGFAAGRIKYRGEYHPGVHERLIDDATFAAYQQVRGRRRPRPRAENSPYLLSGLIKCGECGTPLSGWTANNGPRTVYYRCEAAIISKAHKRKFVQAKIAEGEVLDAVRDLAARAIPSVPVGDASAVADIGHLQRDVERHRSALGRLTVQLVDGVITDEAYKAAAARLEVRVAEAQATLDDAVAAPALPDVSPQTAAELLERWDSMPVSGRRALLHALVERVEVSFEGPPTVKVCLQLELG